MWGNELLHAKDEDCPTSNCALTYQSLSHGSVSDLQGKKLLKLQTHCSSLK